jgi:hypothetical protein
MLSVTFWLAFALVFATFSMLLWAANAGISLTSGVRLRRVPARATREAREEKVGSAVSEVSARRTALERAA